MQIANQKMAEAAVQQIAREYESNTQLAYEAAAAGKWEDAGYHQREMVRLQNEAAPYVQQYQQQAQRAQQQQSGGLQLLPEDEEWIKNNQAVWNDPEKRAEIIKAANSLTVMHGLTGRYPRGSPQFYQAIEHWCGLKDASGGDALPIINDAEVARISKSKYGDVTPDEIQQNKELLAEYKRLGLYRMDPTA
jgi:hypothetical protein